ncbi:MAG TPA: hypothetical protein VFI98_11305 [Pseudolabrys sp.]|jgi:hypothetical protein|nr:hypothetical protein [Pseudolabrys sp.]
MNDTAFGAGNPSDPPIAAITYEAFAAFVGGGRQIPAFSAR